MVELLISVVWALLTYYYAKQVKNRYEDIDIEPTNYLIGGLLFGLISLLWCDWKRFRYSRKLRK